MFRFGKKKVTSEELGQGLWLCCKKFSKSFYEDFKPLVEKAGFKLTAEQEFDLCREITIINLWIISKVLSPDIKALDVLHKIFFSGHRNFAESEQEKQEMVRFAQDELSKRYKTYYDNWDDKSGIQPLLTLEMLQYMLNKGQPNRKLSNAMLSFPINTHIFLMMKAVLDFRKGFEIKD
jgi:hypothetical protein